MQDPLIPACIAFEGGGVLGMAHLGAWQVLARRFQVIATAGTSAGSIVSALCAAGHKPWDVIEKFHELKWPEYVKHQHWFTLFNKRDGWTDGERFYQWISSQLAQPFSIQTKNVTFSLLYQESQIYLAIIASDLNRSEAEPVLFDAKSEPDTNVAFAVRSSISIPGVFVAVPRRDRGQILVDGGLVLNLPLEPLYPIAQREHCPIIGVRFKQPIAYLEEPNVMEVLKRTWNIIRMPAKSVPPEIAKDPNYIDVSIDIAEFNALDFNLNVQRKKELVHRGAEAAELALRDYDIRVLRSERRLTPHISNEKPIEMISPSRLLNEKLRGTRDIYISRSWRQNELRLADSICQMLDKAGFRIVSDARDQPSYDENRVKFIMSSCGGLVAILPDRGQGTTSKYMLNEIKIAREMSLPCLIVAESSVKLPEELITLVLSITVDDLENDLGKASLHDKIETLKEEWKSPPQKHYIFAALGLAMENTQINQAIIQTVERVTGMECVIGDEIPDSTVQHGIIDRISRALVVIANISGNSEMLWNMNVCIEAGIALGAGRELYLISRNQRQSPPFMFRNKQIYKFQDDEDLLALVYRLVFPYRRQILNFELST